MQFDSSNSTNAGSMYLFLPIAEREKKKRLERRLFMLFLDNLAVVSFWAL
jgi:hypothetical protein